MRQRWEIAREVAGHDATSTAVAGSDHAGAEHVGRAEHDGADAAELDCAGKMMEHDGADVAEQMPQSRACGSDDYAGQVDYAGNMMEPVGAGAAEQMLQSRACLRASSSSSSVSSGCGLQTFRVLMQTTSKSKAKPVAKPKKILPRPKKMLPKPKPKELFSGPTTKPVKMLPSPTKPKKLLPRPQNS